ncbi:MAG: hypothetical protein MK086_04185 [Flavobacteriales bacterium]|nr:hypothetical protein [Flavobacteriales bacterium]
MKTVACIIARTNSSRLPLKVLRDCGLGYSVLELLIRRVKTVSAINEIYLCTSSHPGDDIMEDIAIRENIKLYRGSEESVIDRMIEVGKRTEADAVIRITGDNPLTSVEYLPSQIKAMEKHDLDYVRLVDVPIGATAELIRYSALVDCYESMDPNISEYMMLFLFNPDTYRCGILKPFSEDYSDYSVTVDTSEDLARLKQTVKFGKERIESPERISLDIILDAYRKNTHWPALKLSNGGPVKMPYGKSMPFNEFKRDMDSRKDKSHQIRMN